MTEFVLKDETFRQIRDFIYEKSGIFIPDNKKYFIENRLGKKIQEKALKSYEDYLYILKFGGEKKESRELFDLVTTNETFFFREPLQFDLLFGELLAKIIAENGKAGRKDIKIWSAACSTGEEPYTIGMMLLERPEAAGLRKEIVASDISDSVLGSARSGVYGSYSIRNVSEYYMKKYFTVNNQQYNLSPSVKSMVRFLNVNLMEDKDTKALRGFDVVFCRNVLIYFDEKAKQKAVSCLYDALRPNGYLFIGTSESLHNITRAFKPTVINKVIIYQKV
jgi:chemotaxis protein methyltransferase CheR